MALERMEAAEYRELDLASLDARRDAVMAEYDAEGADFDMLDEEARRCADEYDRRNKQAQVRSLRINEVKGGAGSVTERTVTMEGVEDRDFYDTDEYKRSFMDFVRQSRNIEPPSAMYRDGESASAVTSLTGTSTEVGDFTTTIENAVMIPTSMGHEIIRKMREYGNIWPKVRKLNIKGGLWFRIADLQLVATWIDDTEVSKYQEAQDGDKISLSFFELECRFSQTMLSAAVLWDDFQAMFADAVAEAMVVAIEASIIRGTGAENGQPLGIVNDPRVMGVKNQAGTAYTTEPQATIVEMTAEDVDDWKAWRKVLINAPRKYRNKGTWMFGDSTWGMHIDVLEDKDGKPLGKYDPLNDAEPYKILNRPCELFEEEILPSFDDAEVGEVFGIYGDLRNYAMNTQPGMPLSVVKWIDHEDNRIKTKALVAMDGRVIDPYGFVILVKKASA